jgi:hypothetical protein
MFGLFRRNEHKKLEAEYRKLLEQARDLQRNGDIQGFARMTARADELARRLEERKSEEKGR